MCQDVVMLHQLLILSNQCSFPTCNLVSSSLWPSRNSKPEYFWEALQIPVELAEWLLWMWDLRDSPRNTRKQIYESQWLRSRAGITSEKAITFWPPSTGKKQYRDEGNWGNAIDKQLCKSKIFDGSAANHFNIKRRINPTKWSRGWGLDIPLTGNLISLEDMCK